MRCEEIEFSFKIPVPLDKEDGNGVFFTKESIIDACENYDYHSQIPLMQYSKNSDDMVPFGYVTYISYFDGYIYVSGVSYAGGFNVGVEEMSIKGIEKFVFKTVGLDKA